MTAGGRSVEGCECREQLCSRGSVSCATGRWQSVFGLFRGWQLAGRWAAILTGLQALGAEAGLIDWVVSVDATVKRAHSHAAGARRHPETQAELPAGEPADHVLGRSSGGLSTKVHLAVEAGRKPLATVLTPGQAADSPQFTGVLERIRVPRRSGPGRRRTRPDRVLVDKAYSARGNRSYLRRRSVRPESRVGRPGVANSVLGRRGQASLPQMRGDPSPVDGADGRRHRSTPFPDFSWSGSADRAVGRFTGSAMTYDVP